MKTGNIISRFQFPIAGESESDPLSSRSLLSPAMPRLLGNAWDTTVLARVGKRSAATPPSESPVRRLAHPTPPKVAEPDRVYAKGQLLARGSYGMVFKARTGTGAEVCLKEVPLRGLTQSELIQTFQEADLLKALRHDHIIEYVDAFQHGNCLVIVTGLMNGGDLATALEERKQTAAGLPERAIWNLLMQLCEGLGFLHKHRVLHRDLKPSNIFLDSKCDACRGSAIGTIRIGDFGLGRILAPREKCAVSSVGTPIYFAPELCKGTAYDDRVDVWALGCVIYETATLSPPFEATTYHALTDLILHTNPTSIPATYSVELQFLVTEMLQKDPKRRPKILSIQTFPAMTIRVELEHARQLFSEDRFSEEQGDIAVTHNVTRQDLPQGGAGKDVEGEADRSVLPGHNSDVCTPPRAGRELASLTAFEPARRNLCLESLVHEHSEPNATTSTRPKLPIPRRFPWSPGKLGPPLRVPRPKELS